MQANHSLLFHVLSVNSRLQRTPLTADILDLIRQPVLIFHVSVIFSSLSTLLISLKQGARNEMHGLEHAESLKEALTGVEGGAILVPIIGSYDIILDKSSLNSALRWIF
jgi:hypothetical protein